MSENIQLWQGDCLELMSQIPEASVDLIICDLPYGTTACKWDTVIPFEPLWQHYLRISKAKTPICLFGSEPFSSSLRVSNLKMFKHDWIWDKKKPGSCVNAKFGPLKQHEIVSVFCKTTPNYYPILIPREQIKRRGSYSSGETISLKDDGQDRKYTFKYPKSILTDFSNASQKNRLHPTQKPVALLEYLIQTYSQPGSLVLDNCMGSGSTGVACKNLDRKFIGIEKDAKYFEIAKSRLS